MALSLSVSQSCEPPSSNHFGPTIFSDRGCRGSWYLLILLFICTISQGSSTPSIITYRPSKVTKDTSADGSFVIPAGEMVQLIIYGQSLNNDTVIKFTENKVTCDFSQADFKGGGRIVLNANSTSEHVQTGSLSVNIEVPSRQVYYFCVSDEEGNFNHQGSDGFLSMEVEPSVLPLWLEVIFIIVLMVMSGLFSGLNLGLMALDPTTLKIIIESGSKRQRVYANIIYRVRRHGNYLLCTLLLGNVLVNSTLTILLDEVLPSGIYAVIASTLTIVIFGEIIPQAICSRHGLVVGAWTIPVTVLFMILTFPLSLPLSLILNLILGKEIGAVYNRDQLLKLLSVTKEHHDLENDEVDIISGVLAYKKKTAKDVMTNFNDIFCINIDSVLDFKTMKEIYDSGFSRIPVYEDSKENIVHLLYVRDLAFVDSDDKNTLASHVQFYQHEVLFFFEDTPLDDILKGFLEGKSHMGVIQTVKELPDKDPVYVVVGVVTLEDIVEEILQREIVDETDRFTDNRSFKPRKANTIDVGEFMDHTNSLTSQQRLAVYQFLSTEIEPFKEKYISSVVLKRLLTQKNIVQKISQEEYRRKNLCLYSIGSPANFFCLILEGCVEVKIGQDGLIFESRSFSYFGAQVLMLSIEENPSLKYKPDFTARPAADCVVIIITQQQYMAARKASVFEEEKTGHDSDTGGGDEGDEQNGNDVFSEEWTKAEKTGKKSSPAKPKHSQQSKYASKRKTSDLQRLLSGDSTNGEGVSEPTSPVAKKSDNIKLLLEEDVFQNYEGTMKFNGEMLEQHKMVEKKDQSRTSDGSTSTFYHSTQV